MFLKKLLADEAVGETRGVASTGIGYKEGAFAIFSTVSIRGRRIII